MPMVPLTWSGCKVAFEIPILNQALPMSFGVGTGSNGKGQPCDEASRGQLFEKKNKNQEKQ